MTLLPPFSEAVPQICLLYTSTGNELLEVWYYGDLLTVKGEPQSYIIDSDEAPGLVTARDPESGEEFVIFRCV